MSNKPGILYVVATPIGNLEDMSPRAVRILSQAGLIAAEDTRHSGRLMLHFGIRTHMTAFHEHNEREKTGELIGLLRQGQDIALISDAGTPLVSDPGFSLVRAARAAGLEVVPLPGPCAAIAALSASGLPSDRFMFEGFPPAKTVARVTFFQRLARETATLIFYESPHRIVESLGDMKSVFGDQRPALFAREITKQFETLRTGTLAELSDWVATDPNQQRGEIVVIVQGAPPADAQDLDADTEHLLRTLLSELPVKQAASLASRITGQKKNRLYDLALRMAGEGGGADEPPG